MDDFYNNLKLRDGIDIYYDDEESFVIFVFLASRKRLKIKVIHYFVLLISKLNNDDYLDCFNKYIVTEENKLKFFSFLKYLYKNNVLIEKDWIDLLKFDKEYKLFLDRHFKYLLDITANGYKEVQSIQQKIHDANVAIIGLGAVGGVLLQELVMMGFKNFILVDHGIIDTQDISRNFIFTQKNIGRRKIDACEEYIHTINPFLNIKKHFVSINTDTNLNFLDNFELIINSANRPYIGYTSIKLSRYIIEKKNKVLFVCGGFDAHLASLGELIIPGKTPCADCYTNYFSTALKDWKPIKHPVENRENVFGGLASLNLFSASFGAMKILKYYINEELYNSGGRGEFLFDSYQIDKFTVNKDPNCQYCKNLR